MTIQEADMDVDRRKRYFGDMLSEGRCKNANMLFLIFDVGMIVVFAIPVVWLMI